DYWHAYRHLQHAGYAVYSGYWQIVCAAGGNVGLYLRGRQGHQVSGRASAKRWTDGHPGAAWRADAALGWHGIIVRRLKSPLRALRQQTRKGCDESEVVSRRMAAGP